MSELAHRQDVELARCNAALLSAHAHLCGSIAARLGDRIRTRRLVELYSRAHELSPLDEAWVRIHALAHCGAGSTGDDDDHEGDQMVPGAWRALRTAVRSRTAPAGDPALRRALVDEIARADVILLKVHVRNAVGYAQALAPWLEPSDAVAQYITRTGVPDSIAGAVFCLAVARLARHDSTRVPASPPHRLARTAVLNTPRQRDAGLLPASGERAAP